MLLKVKSSNIVKQLNLIRRSPGAEALPNYRTGPNKKFVTMQNTWKPKPSCKHEQRIINFPFHRAKIQHYWIQLFFFFPLCITERYFLYLSWEEAGEASRVPAISMDSSITIYALHKTTVLQNKLTESLPLCIEINHTTYYLTNFIKFCSPCKWMLLLKLIWHYYKYLVWTWH